MFKIGNESENLVEVKRRGVDPDPLNSDPDLDPGKHVNSDPDPGSRANSDPDPDPGEK